MIKKNKLIEARNNKGYSQEAMAACIGKNVSSYNRKENGEIKINHKEWQILAKELDASLEDIYESEESLIFVFNDNASGIGNGIGNTVNYTTPNCLGNSKKVYRKIGRRESAVKRRNLSVRRRKPSIEGRKINQHQ